MNNSANFKKMMSSVILIGVSLLLLALGFYHLYNHNRYLKDGDKVPAIVENILTYPDSTGMDYEQELKYYNELLKYYRDQGIIEENTSVAIIISYSHNGKIHTDELGYFSDSIKIGQVVNIFVNKNDSSDFIYEGENKFGLYFCMIVGGVFLIVGLLFLFVYKYNNKVNLNLMNKGKLVEAEIIYADMDESKSLFNKHPYIFTCLYKDNKTGEEVYFTSESIYCKNNGSSYISKKVNVYVDPQDNNNFYIDVEKFEKE